MAQVKEAILHTKVTPLYHGTVAMSTKSNNQCCHQDSKMFIFCHFDWKMVLNLKTIPQIIDHSPQAVRCPLLRDLYSFMYKDICLPLFKALQVGLHTSHLSLGVLGSILHPMSMRLNVRVSQTYVQLLLVSIVHESGTCTSASI